MAAKKHLNLGLIGSGFMGRCHALSFAAAVRVFDLPITLNFALLADVDHGTAKKAAASLGFERATGDWRQLIEDPSIDIVDVTAPNIFHHEMVMAAVAQGKAVYCEKPLAATAAQAKDMALAAEKSQIVSQVGFNYLKNPLFALAKEIITSGEIGELRCYRGIHAEDYMADPEIPWNWRHDPIAGGGALADLGSHVLATARYLVGPIKSVVGSSQTTINQRPVSPGAQQQRQVVVDDVTRAFLTFANGASGGIEANWIACGRSMQHDFEIVGTQGALAFTQERFNELKLCRNKWRKAYRGFQTICAGPEHQPYGAFFPAAGHQLGFNDLKTIEIRDFLTAVIEKRPTEIDFHFGAEIQSIVEAIALSARNGHKINLND